MKISYVKMFVFMFCAMMVKPSLCACNTLAEVLAVYPNVPQNMCLQWPDYASGATVRGMDIIDCLLDLSVLPKSWAESLYDGRTPLEILAEHIEKGPAVLGCYEDESEDVIDGWSAKSMHFFSTMLEKLVASGAKPTLAVFKKCANNSHFFLPFINGLVSVPDTTNVPAQEREAFVQSINDDKETFLKEVDGEHNSVVDIIINKISDVVISPFGTFQFGTFQSAEDPGVEDPGYNKDLRETAPYKEALGKILKKPGYQVSSKTLGLISELIGMGPKKLIVEEIAQYVIEEGTFANTIDFSAISYKTKSFFNGEISDTSCNLFAKAIDCNKQKLANALKVKSSKISDIANVEDIVVALNGKTEAEREEFFKIFDDTTLKQRIGNECIKQSFDTLPSLVYDPLTVDQEKWMQKIKKCIKDYNADLAVQYSFNTFTIGHREIGNCTQSLYYYLMAYFAPVLKKEHTHALGALCNEWLKKQTPEIQEVIRNEKNPNGQIALYAALDLYAARDESLEPSAALCATVRCLAEAGFDPLIKATKSYEYQVGNENSLDLLKFCSVSLKAAFDQGRPVGVAHLKKLEEMQAITKNKSRVSSSLGTNLARTRSATEDSPEGVKSESSPQLGTDLATNDLENFLKSKSTSESLITPKNIMIGSAITVSLIGIAYGINRMMRKSNSSEHGHDEEAYDGSNPLIVQ